MANIYDKLTRYLQQLPVNVGKRVILTMDDVRRITGSTANLYYPVAWSKTMGKKKTTPYHFIAAADFDVVRIELGFDPSEGCNIVKIVELERVSYNPLDGKP